MTKRETANIDNAVTMTAPPPGLQALLDGVGGDDGVSSDTLDAIQGAGLTEEDCGELLAKLGLDDDEDDDI